MSDKLKFYGKDEPLVETCDFVPSRVSYVSDLGETLREDASPADRKAARMVLEGVFQRYDVQNLNKRTYPKKVWASLLKEDGPVMRKVAERAMIGHLEHPENGSTDLNKGAILVTHLQMNEDKTVTGRLIVLNTPAGRIVQEYVDAGAKIGISSRGTGSVDSKGIVQEDYQVETWDIVYNPSTPGAHVAVPKQSTDENLAEAAAKPAEKKPAYDQHAPHGVRVPTKDSPDFNLKRGKQYTLHADQHAFHHLGVTDAKHSHDRDDKYQSFSDHTAPAHEVEKHARELEKHGHDYLIKNHKGEHVRSHLAGRVANWAGESVDETQNPTEPNMADNAAPTNTPADEIEEALSSVEQEVLIAGPEYVKSRTGIDKPNDLAMVMRRFLKWAKQRGTVDRTIDAAWASFSEVDPMVKGAVSQNNKLKLPENTPVVPAVVPADAPKVDEAAEKLLAEAKTALTALTEEKTALTAQVATLTESNLKMTKELETSVALVSELRESAGRLQAKVDEQTKSLDKAAQTLAALTAVDVAAQVSEAVEEAIRSEPRLANLREALELQKSPAAVEAKAKALIDTLAESGVKPTDKPKVVALAERLKNRARVNEDKGLPTVVVTESEVDAGNKVDESVANRNLHKGAKSAAAAIRKLDA